MNRRGGVLVVIGVLATVALSPVGLRAQGLDGQGIDLLGAAPAASRAVAVNAPAVAPQYQAHGGTTYGTVHLAPKPATADPFFGTEPGPVRCVVVAVNQDGTMAFTVPALAERSRRDGLPARVTLATGDKAADKDLERFEGRILIVARPGQGDTVLTSPLQLAAVGGPAGEPFLVMVPVTGR